MAIVVDHVTKVFSGQTALDDVSLNVPSGQVLGLLGPNGAGKSTLMRLICGYLPPNSGRLEVCGFNVDEDPLETKSRLGYLPESNALPEEMYIREYLRFVAGLFKLSDVSQKGEDVIEQVGLGPEVHKKIGELSKGYMIVLCISGFAMIANILDLEDWRIRGKVRPLESYKTNLMCLLSA